MFRKIKKLHIKLITNLIWSSAAEREGFEPPEACTSTVFKTAAIDRSAISPGAKVTHFSETANTPLALQQQLITPCLPRFTDYSCKIDRLSVHLYIVLRMNFKMIFIRSCITL